MFGWAFGDLMRDRPTITITDDHDIFQGNIWGAGGTTVTIAEWEKNKDARSGYVQPVNMLEVVTETHSAHLPDPVDPTPMDNGIPVYYSDLLYGNVSFAIIADRAFKSGPEGISWWDGRLDHVKDPVEAKKLDDPGLKFKNSPDHNLPNTGEFTDIFGNPHFVYALGNPEDKTSYPNRYRQAISRASGFGISIFDPQTGNIRNEAYRFDSDLDKPVEENMFPGWPVTINKLDNLGNDANIELPIIKVEKDKRPVVKVYDENGELVFAVRTNGDDFTPKVRNAGKYKVIVGYPDSNDWKEYEVTDNSPEAIDIPF